MPNKKKNIILSIIGVALILIMLLGATYAYFQAQIKNGASSDIAIDADTVDVLTFKASNDISFEVTQENFKEGAGNISGTTTLNAHLIANNTNQTASYKYNVYLDITKNNFVYSTSNSTPEIVLVIKNPNGKYVTTTNSKIGKTTKVDLNGEQVTGYDITTKIGLIEISLDYIIDASPSTKGEANQNWEISVVFVNLDSNQVANAGKSFKAKAKVQSEKINVLDLGGEYAYYKSISSNSNYRNQIKNVYFVNYIASEEELNSVGTDANWDLSSLKDKSIMGWLKANNEDEAVPYDLYIGSNLKEGEKIIVRSFAYAFCYMDNIETVDLNLDILDTSNLNDISYMFSGWNRMKIKEIKGIEGLDVSNVTNMSFMLYRVNDLTELNLSTWDISNVTNMSHMFDSASGLTTVGDINNWDTHNVTDMSFMFSGVNSSIIPDISNWDTSKVNDMSHLFNSTSYNYDVSKIDTHNVKDMHGMFMNYSGTEIKGIENLDVSNVTDMTYMFSRTNSLTTLDLSNWDTSKVTNMSYMFQSAGSLTILNLSNWNTSNVTNMSWMFENIKSYLTLNINNWDTSNVTDMSYMFGGHDLQAINYINKIIGIENLDVSNVTNMSYMFRNAIKLTSLDLSNWDTHNVTDMSYMFYDSSKLTSIDMRKATFSQVTSYDGMFLYTNSSLKITVTGEANKNWFLDCMANDTIFGLKESQLDVLPS